MKVFLSFSSANRVIAESVANAIRNNGHEVFFERDHLAPGEAIGKKIQGAIQDCDLFVFLVSAESLKQGRYPLTELMLARRKWPQPSGHLLPVLIDPAQRDAMPAYLKTVAPLEPSGDISAETAIAVDKLAQKSFAKDVAVKFFMVGLLSGVVYSFFPFQGKSIFQFHVFGIAPEGSLVASCFFVLAFALLDVGVRLKRALVAFVLFAFLAISAPAALMHPLNFSPISAGALVEHDLHGVDLESVDEAFKVKIKDSVRAIDAVRKIEQSMLLLFFSVAMGVLSLAALLVALGVSFRLRVRVEDVIRSMALGLVCGVVFWAAMKAGIGYELRILVRGDIHDHFTLWAPTNLVFALAIWHGALFYSVGYWYALRK